MITTVAYTSLGSTVAIAMADGTVWADDAKLPPDTDLRRRLASWIAAGGTIAPFVPNDDPSPVPPPITRRQCAAQLFAEGTISGPEAVAMTATATPPRAIEAVLAAMPEPSQTFARIDFAAGTYERDNSTFAAVLSALMPTSIPSDVDAFFSAAAAR